MQPPPGIVPLWLGPPQALQDWLAALQRAGIAARLLAPPRQSGCGPKVWLAVPEGDAERALQLVEARQREGMSEVERQAADTVIDHDRDENVCPACQTPFRGGPARCPECGLSFGA
jgi:hypothetical protein